MHAAVWKKNYLYFSAIQCLNHFSTTGRNCGTPLRDACVRQACLPAIATSSFKILLTQSFQRHGATCYILPWRAMSRLFNGVNFGRCLSKFSDLFGSFSQNPILPQWRTMRQNNGPFTHYVFVALSFRRVSGKLIWGERPNLTD